MRSKAIEVPFWGQLTEFFLPFLSTAQNSDCNFFFHILQKVAITYSKAQLSAVLDAPVKLDGVSDTHRSCALPWNPGFLFLYWHLESCLWFGCTCSPWGPALLFPVGSLKTCNSGEKWRRKKRKILKNCLVCSLPLLFSLYCEYFFSFTVLLLTC